MGAVLKFQHFWRRQDFLKNVAKVASGSAAAQAIALAVSPILTRLYGPEAFGLLGIFMAIAAILTPLSSLRYDMAVVLPKEEEDAWRLMKLGIWVAGCVGTLSLVAILMFSGSLVGLMQAEEIEGFLLLVPLMIFVSGVLGCVNHWMIRKKRFGLVSTTNVFSTAIASGLKVIGGFVQIGAIGLILGSILQQLLNFLGAGYLARHTFLKTRDKWSDLARLAREYREFPFYRMPQTLLNALTINTPQLLMAAFYNPAVVGLYLLAHRMLKAPAQIIRGAVSSVFYQKAAETKNRGGSMLKLTAKATAGLGILGVLPALFIFIWGESFFAFIFGEEWREAGRYAAWVVLWTYAGFMNVPSVGAIPVMGWNKHFLIYEVFSTTTRIGAVFYGAKYLNIYSMVVILSLVGFFSNLFLIVGTLVGLKFKEHKLAMGGHTGTTA